MIPIDPTRLRRKRPPRSFGAAAALLAGILAAPPAAGAGAPGSQDAAPRAAAEQEVSLEQVASVEGITEYRLSNGLRVLLFPDPSQSNTTVNITYFVGSGSESYGERGMAHLFEHMLFRGTPDHPRIDEELTEHGARANGTTWFDRTNYYETFPASDENLEWALDLEADRMRNSFISEEDLEAERTVVRNEFEMGSSSPFRLLLENTQSAAFRWHNYGNPTIGSRSNIMNVPVRRLRAFYDRYYQPDNALLVVAGRFDAERALELVREKFGAIPRPERDGGIELSPGYTEEPPQRGQREVTVRAVGDTRRVMALYHTPAGSHPDAAAVELLTHLLGDDPSGRLYRALVETGRASGVQSFAFHLRDRGMLLATAEVRREDSLDEARRSFLAVLDSLRERPPTEEEVERARADRLRSLRLLFNDSQRLAIQLSEWAATGDWRLLFVHRDRIEEVTAGDVAAAASRYLLPTNRTVGVFEPTEEEPELARIPAPPSVDSLVAEYRGREEVAAGEAFEPTPENIEARTWRIALPGGFEYAVLTKESRGGSVAARFTLRLGDLEALRGRTAEAGLAAAMLMRGTESRTRQQIDDRLAELQSSLRISGGGQTVSGVIESTRESFPDVLRLLREILREPAFDADEFRSLKEERLASLESERSEPIARAFRTFERASRSLPPDHPERTPRLEEEIEAVRETTLEDVRAFHRRLYGAGSGTLAVVGDVDAERVEPVLERAFGDWTAEVPFRRIAVSAERTGPASETIRIPDRPNAAYVAGLRLPLRDSHPDYPALLLASELLGGGFLSSRLGDRLRNQEGLAYAVGTAFDAEPVDPDAALRIFATYAPESRERVRRVVVEELEKAVADGFTEEEVERARRGWLESRRTDRSDDARLAGTLSGHLYLDRTMEWEEELERKVRQLSPDDVRRALEAHVDPERLIVVTAGDFGEER